VGTAAGVGGPTIARTVTTARASPSMT
jgi:hypothetical protein